MLHLCKLIVMSKMPPRKGGTSVLGTLAKIAGLNGVDVLHIANPPNFMSLTVIIARPQRTVNELTEENSPKR